MNNTLCLSHSHIRTPSRVFLNTIHKRSEIPARDTPIDFGKHKGRLLGTLPPGYLKWVSTNLRAREFLRWAELADEVLGDPIYRDREEWELARALLSGDGVSSSLAGKAAVELSDRFGWDSLDREAWARVDFAMLGTSRSGRIPRKSGGKVEATTENVGKRGGGEGKRAERRERGKLKRRDEKRKQVVAMADKLVEDDSNDVKIASSLLFPGRHGLVDTVRRRFS